MGNNERHQAPAKRSQNAHTGPKSGLPLAGPSIPKWISEYHFNEKPPPKPDGGGRWSAHWNICFSHRIDSFATCVELCLIDVWSEIKGARVSKGTPNGHTKTSQLIFIEIVLPDFRNAIL